MLSLRPGPHLRATWSRYGTIWSKKGTQRIPKLLKISLAMRQGNETESGGVEEVYLCMRGDSIEL
jgi:hypothetical protein